MKSPAPSAILVGAGLVLLVALAVGGLAQKPPPGPGPRPHPPPPHGPHPRPPKSGPGGRQPPPPPGPDPRPPPSKSRSLATEHQSGNGEPQGGNHHSGWSYNDQNGWVVEYPECVGKHLRQSPIDIITSDVVFNPRMQLQFVDYDQDVEFEYKNTHHSVSLTPIPAFATPTVRVNWVHQGTPDEYELQEIHFHWGHGSEKGSEHEINDQRAAAEMHMVHYRKGLDKSQIGSVDNSVVVIGVFIESDAVEHNKLEALVKRAEHVNGTDAEYRDSNPENLIHLLPDNHHSFYTYNGSLTTPPCYEVVTWILMSEPVYMCQDQLEELSNLEVNRPDGGRQKIQSNHREIQPLLLRPVYASFNTTESVSHSQNRIGKRIGTPGQRLSQALGKFWKRVNNVRATVRRAYDSLERVRRSLLSSIGQNAGARARPPRPPPPPPRGP